MRTVLIILVAGLVVLDIVIIGRAVLRMRSMRALRTVPVWTRDPVPERPVRSSTAMPTWTRFRWMEPLDRGATTSGRVRERGGERHG
jgi:hypothetical protein